MRRSLILIAILFLFLTASARAEDYAPPSWPNLVRTMVRFNALNLSDPAVLDEFGIITECDLYKAFYQDDFKWNQVRQAMLQSVKVNVATYPMNYRYDAEVQLSRYDFEKKIFHLTDKTVFRNVNTFQIYAVEGTQCGSADVVIVPRVFKAVISVPVYLDGLPLGEKDAQALLAQMDKDGNSDRIVYARINLRIVYIDPLRKIPIEGRPELSGKWMQSNAISQWVVRLDARLDSINFYADPERTKLIYQYIP